MPADSAQPKGNYLKNILCYLETLHVTPLKLTDARHPGQTAVPLWCSETEEHSSASTGKLHGVLHYPGEAAMPRNRHTMRRTPSSWMHLRPNEDVRGSSGDTGSDSCDGRMRVQTARETPSLAQIKVSAYLHFEHATYNTLDVRFRACFLVGSAFPDVHLGEPVSRRGEEAEEPPEMDRERARLVDAQGERVSRGVRILSRRPPP